MLPIHITIPIWSLTCEDFSIKQQQHIFYDGAGTHKIERVTVYVRAKYDIQFEIFPVAVAYWTCWSKTYVIQNSRNQCENESRSNVDTTWNIQWHLQTLMAKLQKKKPRGICHSDITFYGCFVWNINIIFGGEYYHKLSKPYSIRYITVWKKKMEAIGVIQLRLDIRRLRDMATLFITSPLREESSSAKVK